MNKKLFSDMKFFFTAALVIFAVIVLGQMMLASLLWLVEAVFLNGAR